MRKGEGPGATIRADMDSEKVHCGGYKQDMVHIMHLYDLKPIAKVRREQSRKIFAVYMTKDLYLY